MANFADDDEQLLPRLPARWYAVLSLYKGLTGKAVRTHQGKEKRAQGIERFVFSLSLTGVVFSPDVNSSGRSFLRNYLMLRRGRLLKPYTNGAFDKTEQLGPGDLDCGRGEPSRLICRP